MFALIDCNNFYASCERLFRPDLKNTPIVVLSNNDGCCIARSNEAKALGIAMGEPYFKIKNLCHQHSVTAFSSNYSLYGNVSHRVMSIIESCWDKVEIYSIDEAFLDLSELPTSQHETFCIELQSMILKHTGIPTSIGIGPTKTLAKIANHLCKKVFKTAVFNITSETNALLPCVPIGDVWGVGRQWSKKLMAQGVLTAFDLCATDPLKIKKQFNVVLMRTVMELQGHACIQLEASALKQSILSSKSFNQMQTEWDSIAQAVSSHCARAVDKMRQEKQITKRLSVFLYTNRFRVDLPQDYQTITYHFVQPTDDIRLITATAKHCLKHIFKTGFHYKKAGVMLQDLSTKHQQQLDLFEQPTDKETIHTEQLMTVFDSINAKYGRSTVRLAAEGYSKPWAMRAELKSPAYTTRWSDVPKARIY